MSQPELSLPTDIECLLHQKFKRLGVEAMAKHRLYLDTNFWVLLRKQVTGQRRCEVGQALLEALRTGVGAGTLICTYSGHTLSEIMKHAAPETQVETAQLMDELSHGYCLANQDRLLHNEIVYWMCGWMRPGEDRHDLAHLAWAKPAYVVLDHVPPEFPGLGPSQQRLLQESFIEHLWSMPMTEVMASIQSSAEPYPALDWPASAADRVNAELRDYDHENPTRASMYLSELWGLVDWLGETLVARYQEAAMLWNTALPRTAKELQQCKEVLQNVIMHLARTGSIASDLPGIHIRTALHTEIRWDKGRRFKPNDFMDMEHAQTALPMCDFFFTDGPNAHLI